MAIKILPLIDHEEYEQFRRLLPALPTTFDQWSVIHEQDKAEYARARIDVRAPLVRLAAFANYCKETNTSRDLSALEAYAWRVADENEHARRKSARSREN
jgi:hypothetical protein